MLLDLSFQQENNLLPLFSKTQIIYKQNALYPLLIHIIDKQQPARKLVKPHHYTTWVVTQVTTALWVKVNMPFGSYMSTTVKQKVFVAFVRFHFSLCLWCSVNRDSVRWTHFVTCLSPDHNLQTPRFIKWTSITCFDTFDFKASQCTFFFF